MLKSILSIALAAVITSGVPVANIDAMAAKKLNDYDDNMPVYRPVAELTKSDLLNDEIEHLPDIRVTVKRYPTNLEVFINLWDTINLKYSKHINIEIKDGFDAAEHADIDVENILSDLTEPLYAGFELTDEEIEFLKSELTFYYNAYRR